MKIKIVNGCTMPHKNYVPGEVYTVPTDCSLLDYEYLTRFKCAVEIKDSEPEVKKSKK